jgi:hypothetical protein
MANSRIVVVVAVNGDEVSSPIRMYLRDGFNMPKGNTVVRVDPSADRDGNEKVTLSNSNAGLIASHGPNYVEGILKGFRKKQGDSVFVVVKEFKDNIPSIKELEGEAF